MDWRWAKPLQALELSIPQPLRLTRIWKFMAAVFGRFGIQSAVAGNPQQRRLAGKGYRVNGFGERLKDYRKLEARAEGSTLQNQLTCELMTDAKTGLVSAPPESPTHLPFSSILFFCHSSGQQQPPLPMRPGVITLFDVASRRASEIEVIHQIRWRMRHYSSAASTKHLSIQCPERVAICSQTVICSAESSSFMPVPESDRVSFTRISLPIMPHLGFSPEITLI